MHTFVRSSPWLVRALTVLALALTAGCRGGPRPRFVLWEPAGGWLAAEHANSTFEARATVIAPVDPDHRVVVEVEKMPLHQATEHSTVAAKNEGRFFSAELPTAGQNSQTRYRWAVQSASRVTAAGQPIVLARSDTGIAMTVGSDHPTFSVLAPAEGATNLGQPIPGDLDRVTVLFEFRRDGGNGSLVDYIVRVEDESQRIEWFGDGFASGLTERRVELTRGTTFRCVSYGVYPRFLPGLGTYRVYVRGEERTITTRP